MPLWRRKIMVKKGLIALLALIVMAGLTACGKKDVPEEAAAPVEEAAPSIVPGEMVLIPAGEFVMGINDKKSNAYPEHKVNLPAYWMDKYEVTNYEFLQFSIANSYTGEGAKEGKDWRLFASQLDKGNVPVVYITWNDAQAYCKAKGKRLPTEAEWEKAARGPSGNAYPWGNEWKDGASNTHDAGLVKAVDVGQFSGDVSFFGVFDMLGNVQEWTDTKYATYPGNPKKDSQPWRVVRGLSNRYKGKLGKLWDRAAQPQEALFDFGCRCAKDATPEDIAKLTQK
jgi:formylglycine-generating enzyme required for sulfatase activity